MVRERWPVFIPVLMDIAKIGEVRDHLLWEFAKTTVCVADGDDEVPRSHEHEMTFDLR
jgi:hypothetical protein